MLLLELSEATAARRRLPIVLVDATDGITAETGITFSAGDIKVSKNGAAEANHGGTVTELAGGDYYYEATAGELDTLGYLTLRFVKAGVRTFRAAAQVVAFDPYAATNLGLTNLSGDAFVRLGAPAGASVSADILAVKNFVDDIGAAGVGLTAIPWNAAWDAEVQSEAADAITAYAPLTAAGYTAPPTATQNADALLDRDMAAGADTQARSPRNAFRAIRNKVSRAGATVTVTKEDDATPAWTAALTTDAAAVPITVIDPA